MTNAVREILLRYYGKPIVDWAETQGVKVYTLHSMEKYKDVSSALRRLGVDVDSWPVPPAGLFVVDERTVYLRIPDVMTVCHEFGHALDCALGGGIYRSGYDSDIRSAFAWAHSFVTPYAATGLDEYFAESVRAYIGANSASCPWPPATRERLLAVDPKMHGIIESIFAEINEGALIAA